MTLQPVSVRSLSAPEILVLLDPGVPPPEVLKVALKELRASGKILLERVQPPYRAQLPQNYLSFTTQEPTPNPVLRRLVEQLRKASRNTGNMQVVLQRLQQEHGYGYGHFKHKTVIASLVEQGLLEPYSRRVLGVFTTHSRRHTSEGQRLKEQLQHDMDEARRVARLIKDDPAQVVALMASLGAAVLLIPELWPHLAEINRLIREEEGDGFVFMGGWDGDVKQEDLSGLDQDFASLDSSVDGSGADGGGDGGGGGGGGE